MGTFLSSTGSVCLVTGLCLSLSGRVAVADSALTFDGVNDYVSVGSGLFPNVTNTFTIELWANPTASRAPTPEGTAGYPGTGGQRYAIFPDYGRQAYGSDAHAGAGISIGTNGASVFELAGDYMPSPLVYTNNLPGWAHFAVTYSNGLPRLYVGGHLVRTGLVSGRLVHPSADLGESGYGYGYYQGMLDEVRLWRVALDEATLQSWLNREVNSSHPAYGHLIGYWRLNEGRGTNTADSTTPGHHATLLNGTAWATPGAPIIGLNDPLVLTDPASELADTSAHLEGTVNPQANATTAWFEWGSSANYELATPRQAVGAVDASVNVSNIITGLAPLSPYYFRIAASNSMGVSRGIGRQLKTTGPPAVTTLVASNLSTANATLQGAVAANGHATWAWFEWGLTTNYGNATPRQSAGSGPDGLVVTQALPGLPGGQEYHYRMVATNSSGMALGLDQWFSVQWLTNALVLAQPYTGGGAIYWGDFDNSGRLDLLELAGRSTSSVPVLWLNMTNRFNPRDTTIPLFGSGAAVVGDLSNDGFLDVVIRTGVFLNVGSGFPTRWPQPPNYWDAFSSGALGDFDNDGHLDLLLTGQLWGGSGYLPVTSLYRNDGGRFTSIATNLPLVLNGAVAWGDYDNDGQLDILLAGDTGTESITRVYHNDNGVFTDIGASLLGVASGSAAWGDFDGDGWPDILLAGTTNGSPDGAVCRIYRNNHDGTFTDVGAKLPGVYNGTAAWGDFDNDGQLDVLLVGWVTPGSSQRASSIYRNDHGTFSDAGAGLPAYVADNYDLIGGGGWGDYDGDGRLDVALSATSLWDPCRVYRNGLATTNTIPNPPSPPSGLVASAGFNSVTLRWDAGKDPHTPTPGLTYNIRIGTTPAGTQFLSPASDPITGKRHLPQIGNAQHRLFATFTNVPLGRYYWTVQTVNPSFVGSPWPVAQSFDVTNGWPVFGTQPASDIRCCSAVLNGVITPRGQESTTWFEWGTTTNLGNATPPGAPGSGLLPVPVTNLLSGLQPSTPYYFRLVASNASGLAFGAPLTFTTEVPAPVVATLTASNVAYTTATPFGTAPLSSFFADYFIEWGTTPAYGNLGPAAIADAALHFDGIDDCVAVAWGQFPSVANNFTMELWVNPTAARAETVESASGYAGASGQRYAVFPEVGWVGYGGDSAVGAGVSVGTNGISVMECTRSHMPSVLVYSNGVSGWTHVALVYSNQMPRLFVNAALARSGLTSSLVVHPSVGLGGVTNSTWSAFGPFAGEIQDARIWDVPLDAPTIQAWMNQNITSNHPAYSHLQGYWPSDEGRGANVTDLSPRKNSGQLLNGTAWTGGRRSRARLFRVMLEGLAPDTTYHFRAVAINPGGTAYGADQTFKTLPLPRVAGVTVQTAPATAGSLLRFSGLPGLGYVMEASTNLVDWLALTNLVAGSDGGFEYLDTSAPNFPTRFYRLRVP